MHWKCRRLMGDEFVLPKLAATYQLLLYEGEIKLDLNVRLTQFIKRECRR